MYAFFVKHVTLPIYSRWHGWELFEKRRIFERSQWFSQERLQEMQWTRLSEMLRHAYENVPYYREQFKSIGATPNDIKTFEDYQKFPSLSKKNLQERLQDLLATNASSENTLKGVTSGSSGQPTYYYQDIPTNALRAAAGKRLTKIAGCDIGMRVFYFWRDSAYSIAGEEIRKDEAQKAESLSGLAGIKQALYARFAIQNPALNVDPTWLNDSEMKNLHGKLLSFRPRIIISYVNALYRFAQFLEAENLSGIRPRSIIVSSETLHEHQRELMEKVFGCRVYNRYGLKETGIVAIDCPKGEGMHINQEILHIEYRPSISDTTELLVTDLINTAMPILRYETGDNGTPIEEPCPCGRGLSRIGQLQGRIIELLPTKLGGHINGQLFATFHWIEGIKQYQVIQREIDKFVIRIAPDKSFKESNLDPMLETIRERFGRDAAIEIDYTDNIPYTKGCKYKLVVSEVTTNTA